MEKITCMWKSVPNFFKYEIFHIMKRKIILLLRDRKRI